MPYYNILIYCSKGLDHTIVWSIVRTIYSPSLRGVLDEAIQGIVRVECGNVHSVIYFGLLRSRGLVLATTKRKIRSSILNTLYPLRYTF